MRVVGWGDVEHQISEQSHDQKKYNREKITQCKNILTMLHVGRHNVLISGTGMELNRLVRTVTVTVPVLFPRRINSDAVTVAVTAVAFQK